MQNDVWRSLISYPHPENESHDGVGCFVTSGGVEVRRGLGVYIDTAIPVGGTCTVSHGGRAILESGGYMQRVRAMAPGEVQILSGGSCYRIDIGNSATVEVDGGMIEAYAYVNSDGVLNNISGGHPYVTYVSAGGLLNSASVDWGTMVDVYGGTATAIKENGGQVIINGGTAEFLPNIFGGTFYSNMPSGIHKTTVHSGTTASQCYYQGGEISVFEGGIVDTCGFTRSLQVVVSSGGITRDTFHIGGNIDLLGATATNMLVCSTGQLNVSSGTTLTGATVTTGSYTDISESTLSGATFYHANSISLRTSATLSNAFLDFSERLRVSSGATFSSSVVYSGEVNIYNGATVRDISVGWGARLDVPQSATVTEIKENGGYVDDIYGVATYVPSTFSGTFVGSNTMTIHSGTVATNCTLGGGCQAQIRGGQLINGTASQSRLFVQLGGVCESFSFGDETQVDVFNTARVISARVTSGGVVVVSSGGLCTAVGNIERSYWSAGRLVNEMDTGGKVVVVDGGTFHLV